MAADRIRRNAEQGRIHASFPLPRPGFPPYRGPAAHPPSAAVGQRDAVRWRSREMTAIHEIAGAQIARRARRIGNIYYAPFGAAGGRGGRGLAATVAAIRKAVETIHSVSGAVAQQHRDLSRLASDASRKLTEVMGVVDAVTFESNVLALNAALEASRGGEVENMTLIAEEIHRLVERCGAATQEVQAAARDTTRRVEGGNRVLDEVAFTLADVLHSVRQVTEILGELGAVGAEQRSALRATQAAAQVECPA